MKNIIRKKLATQGYVFGLLPQARVAIFISGFVIGVVYTSLVANPLLLKGK